MIVTMHIDPGMEVYGADGEKLGKVTRVWPDVTDPPSDVPTTGYFQMERGGVLGIGAKDLYVPYSAVDDYVAGECVTLGCSKDNYDTLYGNKPDFLEQGA